MLFWFCYLPAFNKKVETRGGERVLWEIKRCVWEEWKFCVCLGMGSIAIKLVSLPAGWSGLDPKSHTVGFFFWTCVSRKGYPNSPPWGGVGYMLAAAAEKGLSSHISINGHLLNLSVCSKAPHTLSFPITTTPHPHPKLGLGSSDMEPSSSVFHQNNLSVSQPASAWYQLTFHKGKGKKWELLSTRKFFLSCHMGKDRG